MKIKHILLFFTIILVLAGSIYIFKPYIKEYTILNNGEEIQVRENIINHEISMFDVSTLTWIDRNTYMENIRISIELEKKAKIEADIDAEFDKLVVTDYKTVVSIVAEETGEYYFLTDDQLQKIKVKLLIGELNNETWEEIKERRKETMAYINSLVEQEKQRKQAMIGDFASE